MNWIFQKVLCLNWTSFLQKPSKGVTVFPLELVNFKLHKTLLCIGAKKMLSIFFSTAAKPSKTCKNANEWGKMHFKTLRELTLIGIWGKVFNVRSTWESNIWSSKHYLNFQMRKKLNLFFKIRSILFIWMFNFYFRRTPLNQSLCSLMNLCYGEIQAVMAVLHQPSTFHPHQDLLGWKKWRTAML